MPLWFGVVYLLVGRGVQARTTNGGQAAPTSAPIVADSRVSAEAKVVPARVAGLSLPTGGIVAEVLVAEGATGRRRPEAGAAGLGPPGRGGGPG